MPGGIMPTVHSMAALTFSRLSLRACSQPPTIVMIIHHEAGHRW
jgi:hypothetical protein